MNKQPFFPEAAEGQTSEPQQIIRFGIPKAVMDDDRLPRGAKQLFGVIFSLQKTSGECFASTARLAEETGSKPRTIQFWLEKLEKCGYIRREINRKAAKARKPQRRIYITEPFSTKRGTRLHTGHATRCSQNIKKDNIPPYSPPKGEKESCFDFEAFWDMYGKEIGRAICEKKYARPNETVETPEERDRRIMAEIMER